VKRPLRDGASTDRRRFLRALGATAGLAVLDRASDQARADPPRAPAMGPLRASRRNPRYFEDPSGAIVYLTGSHTWPNLIDMGPSNPPAAFDFEAYLGVLTSHGHNFIRLWTWESSTWDTIGDAPSQRNLFLYHASPLCWRRTGPGVALDGKPRFNLDLFAEAYFDRLSRRVRAARERGIYVSVMLFEGWGLQFAPGAWESHPFHPANNVNGLNADSNLDGSGIEVHTLAVPAVTRMQERYVRKVIDTVNACDNILYEICNEAQPESTEWQYHMIEFVRKYERSKAFQHPVGMTLQHRHGLNSVLQGSAADWISPGGSTAESLAERALARIAGRRDYRFNPPPSDGRKVIVPDTDHNWGIGGSQGWVWKSFLRGLNPIFMDPYDGMMLAHRLDPRWEAIRRSMGYTRRYSQRINLAAMLPREDLASSRYCLAEPGRTYLVYLSSGHEVTVDLSSEGTMFSVEWFDPNTDTRRDAASAKGGGRQIFRSPFPADAVLLLRGPA
jgi:hypothetical protein